MSMISRILHGARALFTRDAVNQQLDDEVRDYLERSIAANVRQGMSHAAAERAARVALGSIASVQEPARNHGWDVSVESVLKDFRYAGRYLARSSGFTVAAAASLALGIGANTAIFSMVNALLIKRLPVAHSDELVTIATPGGSGVFSYPGFDGMRRESGTVLTGMLGFGGISVSMTEGDGIDLVSGAIVTGNYFQLLGIRPARGRLLQPGDDVTPGAHPVAVISDALWKRRFAERPDIAGLPVRLNGQPFTIIGVAPPGFFGTQVGNVRDVWVPMMMQAWMRPPRAGYSGEQNPDLLNVRTNGWIFAIGRLKPGVSIVQAEEALTNVARAMGHWTRPTDSLPRMTVARLDDGPPGQREQLTSVATLLTGVVLTVLIIACANVANLLLSRATARRKEIAVRLSVGATRGRLVRQLLTESIMLAALGGLLGLALAWAAIRAVRGAPPPAGALPVFIDFAIDWRVLAYTLGLSVVTGIVFGLVPALRASRPDLVPALKDQASTDQGRHRWSARNGLVIGQVALSLVLLIASGLFTRSLARARSLDPGFDAERLLTVPLNIQLLRYTSDQGKAFYRDVVERVQAIPGVESATIARWLPITGGRAIASLEIEGQDPNVERFQSENGDLATDNPRTVLNNTVGISYLRTMGIRLTRGRDFDASDNESAGERVAIVTEQFARRHFGDESPLGKRISLNGPMQTNGMVIVGVAADAKYGRLEENPARLVYMAAPQNYVNGMSLIVRTRSNPGLLRDEVTSAVHSLDRSLPVAGARTYEEWIGISLYAARAGAILLTGFGVLAIVLAAVGLYGVLAYAVARRAREFGLRMALGAEAHNVLRQVLGEGLGLVLVGVAGGLVAALSVTRLLARFLYGISPTDPITFAWTPVVLVSVAVLACLLPAIRATRVDPIKALKQE